MLCSADVFVLSTKFRISRIRKWSTVICEMFEFICESCVLNFHGTVYFFYSEVNLHCWNCSLTHRQQTHNLFFLFEGLTNIKALNRKKSTICKTAKCETLIFLFLHCARSQFSH
jgi:hypothetical protein